MVLVAKARHLEEEDLPLIDTLTAEITALAEDLRGNLHASEPLLCWFDPRSAQVFRSTQTLHSPQAGSTTASSDEASVRFFQSPSDGLVGEILHDLELDHPVGK